MCPPCLAKIKEHLPTVWGTIVLGSASPIKVAAVQQVFPESTIVPVAVSVDTPEQPVGRGQTLKGAMDRVSAAREQHPDAQMYIGIENGMMQEEGEWVDRGAIVFISVRGAVEDLTQGWTAPLSIPSDHPKGENGCWSALKDPHSVITHGTKPRQKFLTDAMHKMHAGMEG